METILKHLKFGNHSNKKHTNNFNIELKKESALNFHNEKISSNEINEKESIKIDEKNTVFSDNSDLYDNLNKTQRKIKMFNKLIKKLSLHKEKPTLSKNHKNKAESDVNDYNTKLTKYRISLKNNFKIYDSLKEELFRNLNLEIKSYNNFQNEDILPLCSFNQIQKSCNFSETFCQIILEKYKFKTPSPIQSCVIPFLLNSSNLIATSSTGSGKTMSYLLPIFSKLLKEKFCNKKAFIILPTKELCRQIYNEFSYFSSVYCNSKIKIKIIIKDLLNSISNESEFDSFLSNSSVFIGTPQSILNLISIEYGSKKLLKSLGFLILDEADKMFEENSFNNSIQEILNIVVKYENKLLKKISMSNSNIKDDKMYYKLVYSKKIAKCFFSATMNEQIIEYLKSLILDIKVISIGSFQLPCKLVHQTFKYCTNYQGKIFELKNFLMNKFSPPALVFVDDLETASKLYEAIKYEIPKVDLLHGKLDNVNREEIIKKLRVHDIWVLITSDLISRGLDFKNINTVINFDCPESYVTYIHRVGRTGRAGKNGVSFTYITDEDRYKLKNLKKILLNSENINCPDWMKNVK